MSTKLSLERIYHLPPLQKWLFITAINLVIISGIYYLNMHNLYLKWHQFSQENSILQAKLEKITTKKANKSVESINLFSNYAVTQLRAIGFLQQATERWGILADPAGNLASVTIGTRIGIDASVIIDLNAQEIVIAEQPAETQQMHKTVLPIKN